MAEIAVTGATGRMGQTVIQNVQDSEDFEIAFAVDKEEDEIEGVQVRNDDNFGQLLESEQPDAIVDFTAPEATLKYAEAAAENGVPLVTGTTGFTREQLEELKSYGNGVAVLKASNFSQGIQALRKAVREIVSALPGYDVEVTETHHNQKVDAPSGTANTIVEDIEEERSDIDRRVHGRKGDNKRREGDIGVHAKRAGDVRGEHEILVAGNHEAVTLKHRSESRQVFSSGALTAAEWIQNREDGYYNFEDVIGGNDE